MIVRIQTMQNYEEQCDAVKDESLKWRFKLDIKNCETAKILRNEVGLLDYVTIDFHDNWIGGDRYTMYRTILRGASSEQIALGEFCEDEKAQMQECFEKACNNLVRCNYCGKWMPYEESVQVLPAGRSCTDVICRTRGEAASAAFLKVCD